MSVPNQVHEHKSYKERHTSHIKGSNKHKQQQKQPVTMLAADKLQLQSHLKQQAVSLKEKEFKLHHENLMTVGTQAAVLAGLDITMLIEFQPAPLQDWQHVDHHLWTARLLQLLYYTLIVAAFGCNMRVVAQTTALSVLGAGLALRGPDGSVVLATDCLYEERAKVFGAFGAGLALTVASLMVAVWLVLQWEAAGACTCVAAWTATMIWKGYRRVRKRLDFDERETVDFRDLMEVAGSNSNGVRRKKNKMPKNGGSSRRASNGSSHGGSSSNNNNNNPKVRSRYETNNGAGNNNTIAITTATAALVAATTAITMVRRVTVVPLPPRGKTLKWEKHAHWSLTTTVIGGAATVRVEGGTRAVVVVLVVAINTTNGNHSSSRSRHRHRDRTPPIQTV